MADFPAAAIRAVCDDCGSPAAALLASRRAHERWACRLSVESNDPPDPEWRCSGCLAAALESVRYCALGVGGPHSDPRLTGVLVAHARDAGDAWAQLCGLLVAVPERLLVSVALRQGAPEPWLLLFRFPYREFAERSFSDVGCLVAALSDALESMATAEVAAGY